MERLHRMRSRNLVKGDWCSESHLHAILLAIIQLREDAFRVRSQVALIERFHREDKELIFRCLSESALEILKRLDGLPRRNWMPEQGMYY